VPWVEIFAVFAVCHLVGDFALQTEWQAQHKRGGLGPDPVARRALATHVSTYTLAFVPAFVWLWDSLGAGTLAVAAVIAGTHLIQDDGRVVDAYMRLIKHTSTEERPLVAVMVDQTFHGLLLFAVALVAGA
jgi:Protein of unknown function (DUF3307)